MKTDGAAFFPTTPSQAMKFPTDNRFTSLPAAASFDA
jgi:hypothetical protein